MESLIRIVSSEQEKIQELPPDQLATGMSLEDLEIFIRDIKWDDLQKLKPHTAQRIFQETNSYLDLLRTCFAKGM